MECPQSRSPLDVEAALDAARIEFIGMPDEKSRDHADSSLPVWLARDEVRPCGYDPLVHLPRTA